MPQMNMIEAIRSAHDVMMERDATVVVLGEDVGYFGGVFRCTDGLQRKFGEHRVIDAPIAEGGIIGAAIGMGVNGLRPVAEIQFADYIYPGFDQIVSELARLRYRSAGEFFSPVTIRTPCGGGIRGGQTHSQSPEGVFTHVSGIKTVMPSNPYDAKGLLIAAIESDDPVIFFEPKRIYNGPFDGDPDKPGVSWASHPKGEVPNGYYTVPLGTAEVALEGEELTIITYGTLVHVAIAAARETGVDAEVIDVRTLAPLARVAARDPPHPHPPECQYAPALTRTPAGIPRLPDAPCATTLPSRRTPANVPSNRQSASGLSRTGTRSRKRSSSARS